MTTFSFTLPKLPSDGAKTTPPLPKDNVVVCKVPIVRSCEVIAVGNSFYHNLLTADVIVHGFNRVSQSSANQMEKKINVLIDKFEDFYVDDVSDELLNADPLEWKHQDHYEVLGLPKMRYKASDDDIKKAYRRKVLKHHPDKKNADADAPKDEKADNYFKCLQKAYEFMSNPVFRRQWDSVDPEFDDSVPTAAKVQKKGFYKVFGPVFEANSHFSVVQPVPQLGDDDSSNEHVNNFYDFWSTFNTWRSFERLPVIGPEGEELPSENECENRDEKRWIEKMKKSERAKRKKEETARLFKLVDTAMKLDPRLIRIKEDEKREKEKKKREKEEAVLKAQEEIRLAEEKAKLDAERLLAEEKERKLAEKERKNKRKMAARNLKKEIKQILSEKYYSFEDAKMKKSTLDDQLEMMFSFFGNDNVEAYQGVLSTLQSVDNLSAAYEAWLKEMNKVDSSIQVQKLVLSKDEEEKIEKRRQAELKAAQEAAQEALQIENSVREWTDEEIRILIKAVNMFPGGTPGRWETIATYIQEHADVKQYPPRKPDQVIKMSKIAHNKEAVNLENLQQRKKKESLVMNNVPTVVYPISDSDESRPNTPKNANGKNKSSKSTKSNNSTATSALSSASSSPVPIVSRKWSNEEQIVLQNALRKYPNSGKDAYTLPDRWEKVAAEVEGRTVEEVMARVKECALKGKLKKKK